MFEAVAKRSLRALWRMRTELDLLGSSLDVTTATWQHHHGGIGAGSDSFYEYLLKAYLLFGTHPPSRLTCIQCGPLWPDGLGQMLHPAEKHKALGTALKPHFVL